MALKTPVNDDFGPLALPLAWASFWSDVAGEAMTASVAAWSALAESALRAQEAFVAVWGQTEEVVGAEALTIVSARDEVLAAEVAASEHAIQRLALVAEDALVHPAGEAAPPAP